MKIEFTDEFKMGYLKAITIASNPDRLNRNLKEIVQLLEQGYKKLPNYTTTAIKGENKWYNCYAYTDTQYIIIVQYRIVGTNHVELLRMGPIEDFIDCD